MALSDLTPSRVLDLGIDDGLLEVDTVIRNPAAAHLKGIRLRGIIDTGSFATIIPHEIVRLLSLREGGKLRVRPIYFGNVAESGDAGAKIKSHEAQPMYPVQVQIQVGSEQFTPRRVLAVPARRANVIIGRDLLQWFTLHFYGSGALNPDRTDDRHDPGATPPFFELGRGLLSARHPKS